MKESMSLFPPVKHNNLFPPTAPSTPANSLFPPTNPFPPSQSTGIYTSSFLSRKRRLQNLEGDIRPQKRVKVEVEPDSERVLHFLNGFDRILVLGEEDFSLSYEIASTFSKSQVTATAYKPNDYEKDYKEELGRSGKHVIRTGVDVTNPDCFAGEKWDAAIFTYPRAFHDFSWVKSEYMEKNRIWFEKLFDVASTFLKPGGTLFLVLIAGHEGMFNFLDASEDYGFELERLGEFDYKYCRYYKPKNEKGKGWRPMFSQIYALQKCAQAPRTELIVGENATGVSGVAEGLFPPTVGKTQGRDPTPPPTQVLVKNDLSEGIPAMLNPSSELFTLDEHMKAGILTLKKPLKKMKTKKTVHFWNCVICNRKIQMHQKEEHLKSKKHLQKATKKTQSDLLPKKHGAKQMLSLFPKTPISASTRAPPVHQRPRHARKGKANASKSHKKVNMKLKRKGVTPGATLQEISMYATRYGLFPPGHQPSYTSLSASW